MSRRYRRVMRRLYLSTLIAVVTIGSVGAVIGAVLTLSTGSWSVVATVGVLLGGSGYVGGLLVRPSYEDIRDVTGEES